MPNSDDRVGPPGYFRIENDLVDRYAERVGPIAFAVRVVLGRFAHNKTRRCYPSTRKIARLLHVSQHTALNAVAVLEQEGLVKIERRRTKGGLHLANVYTLPAIGGAERGAAPVLNEIHHRDEGDAAPVLNDVHHRDEGDASEQDLINKTQENKGESAPSRRPPAPVTDPNMDHPAVVAYRELCGRMPNGAQRAAIVAAVSDIELWGEVIREWLLADWRKQNVAGMLDRYKNGRAEGSGDNGRSAFGGRSDFQGKGHGERRGARPPETAEERAELDARWESLARESRRRSESGE